VPVARLSVDGVCARPGGRLRRAPTDYRLSISSPKFRGACVDESGILLLTLTMSSSRVLGSGAQRPRGGGNQPPATRRRRRRVVGTARGNPPSQARHAPCLHRGRPSPKGCRSGSSSGDPRNRALVRKIGHAQTFEMYPNPQKLDPARRLVCYVKGRIRTIPFAQLPPYKQAEVARCRTPQGPYLRPGPYRLRCVVRISCEFRR
jgi:hypothetical protein